MSHKTALVLSGGGCAISFSTGILFSLLEKYQLEQKHIDMLFAGSAGCSLGVFFLTDLIDEWKIDGMNMFDDKKFVNPYRFWKIMDIDHLVYNIYEGRYGISSELLQKKAEQTPFYIGATNTDSGKAKLFESHDRNALELVKASMALPILYGKEVPINNETYFDNIYSQSSEFLIHEAISHGADDVIVIDPGIYEPSSGGIANMWTRTRNSRFRHQFNEYEKKRRELHSFYGLPDEGIQSCYNDHILYLSPTQNEFKHNLAQVDLISVKTSVLEGKVYSLENELIKLFLGRII